MGTLEAGGLHFAQGLAGVAIGGILRGVDEVRSQLRGRTWAGLKSREPATATPSVATRRSATAPGAPRSSRTHPGGRPGGLGGPQARALTRLTATAFRPRLPPLNCHRGRLRLLAPSPASPRLALRGALGASPREWPSALWPRLPGAYPGHPGAASGWDCGALGSGFLVLGSVWEGDNLWK